MDVRKKCVALLLLFYHTGAALEILVPSTHQATMGSSALIPCRYTVVKPPVKPNFFAAFWNFGGKEILSFDDQVRTVDSRYSLNIEKALNGTVDLSISKIVMSDAGVYTCTVLYSPMWRQKEITVVIKAPPQVTITGNTVVMNKESVLRCFITGFYPVDIDIRWFRDGERLEDNIIVGDPWRNPDRTYSVNSSVTITPTEEDRERNFSCRVRHESLKEPLQEDFRLIYRDKNMWTENQPCHITIPVIVAVSSFVIILNILGIVYCKCKKKRPPHPEYGENTTSAINVYHAKPMDRNAGPLAATESLEIGPIEVPELILGQRATLDCLLYDYILGVHTVKWIEKKMEIITPIAVNDQRRIITTERDEESDDKRNYKSYLALMPVKRSDHGIKYICRVELSNSGQMRDSESTEELYVTGVCDQIVTPEKETQKERNTQKPRKKENEGLWSEKQIPVQIHKTSAEQEKEQLGEYDNIKHRQAPNNENSKGLCPAIALSGDGNKEHPLHTNNVTDKLYNEQEFYQSVESSTREGDEEELNKGKKKNKETTQVINKPFNEQEIDKPGEKSTREDEELNKAKKDNEKMKQIINEPFNVQKIDQLVECSTKEDEEELHKERKANEEASQLTNNPYNEQESDTFVELSTKEDEKELNKEKREDNEDNSQIINNPNNEKETELKENSKEVRRANDGGLCSANESPEEDNDETSLLNNNMELENGLKERPIHDTVMRNSDGLCAANQLSDEEDDDDETKPLNNKISD